jgi:hypothetical protein
MILPTLESLAVLLAAASQSSDREVRVLYIATAKTHATRLRDELTRSEKAIEAIEQELARVAS